jgi:uncharacterized protein (DUF2235 family)
VAKDSLAVSKLVVSKPLPSVFCKMRKYLQPKSVVVFLRWLQSDKEADKEADKVDSHKEADKARVVKVEVEDNRDKWPFRAKWKEN